MAKKKKPRAASLLIRDQGVVEVLQDTRLLKEGKAFARRIHRAEFSKGEKPSVDKLGASRVSEAVAKMRAKSQIGEAFNESVTVKIRYRGANGKMKVRHENLTSARPEDIDEFVAALNQGIRYENKQGEAFARAPGVGKIIGVKYEKISKVEKDREAAPTKSRHPFRHRQASMPGPRAAKPKKEA